MTNRALVYTYTGHAAALLAWADTADAYLDGPRDETAALRAIERARASMSATAASARG